MSHATTTTSVAGGNAVLRQAVSKAAPMRSMQGKLLSASGSASPKPCASELEPWAPLQKLVYRLFGVKAENDDLQLIALAVDICRERTKR